LALPMQLLMANSAFMWLQVEPNSTPKSPLPMLSKAAASRKSASAASMQGEASSRLPWAWAVLLGACIMQRFPTFQSRRAQRGQPCVIACRARAQCDTAAPRAQLHMQGSMAVGCCGNATAILHPQTSKAPMFNDLVPSLYLHSERPTTEVARGAVWSARLAGTAVWAGQARHAVRRRSAMRPSTKQKAASAGRRRMGARLNATHRAAEAALLLPEPSFDPTRQRTKLQFGLQAAQNARREPMRPAVFANRIEGSPGTNAHTIRVHGGFRQTQTKVIDTCAATRGTQTVTDWEILGSCFPVLPYA